MLRLLAAGPRRPLITLLILAAVTMLAAAGLTRLRFDDDYRSIFRSNTPSFRALEELTDEFGREENDVYLLFELREFAAPDELRRIADAVSGLRAIPAITTVYSALDHPLLAPLLRRGADDARLRQAGERAFADSTLRGRLVADDGRWAMVVARLGESPWTLAELTPSLRAIDSIASTQNALVSGIPVLRAEIIRGVQRDQLVFNIVAILAVGLVALVVLQDVGALIIAGTGPALGVVWMLGAMGWIGEPVNVLNNVLPQLVLAIGFTDSIHLLFHFRRARQEGHDSTHAASQSVRHVGLACAMTSITTSIGFASLALSHAAVIQRFGLVAAGATILSFFAVLLLAPLMCTTRLADRWGRHQPRGNAMARLRLSQVLDFSLHRPRTVALGTAVLLLALGWSAALARPDYRYTENLPDGSVAHEAVAVRDAHFGGSQPVFVQIVWPPDMALDRPEVVAAVREVARVVETEDLIRSATSVLTVAAAEDPARDAAAALARLPAPLLNRWVGASGRSTVVAGLLPDSGAATLAPTMARLEREVDRLNGAYPSLEMRVAGLTVVATEASLGMLSDLTRSLGTAAAVILILVVVVLRSVRLGLVCIVPNLLPLLGVAGVLGLTGTPLQYSGIAVLTVGLGLAVDDSLHMVAAYRRSRDELGVRAAVRSAAHKVGGALCATTALLGAGLASVGLSSVPTIRQFGLLMCVLLAFALLADLVVLPASLVGLRRRGS